MVCLGYLTVSQNMTVCISFYIHFYWCVLIEQSTDSILQSQIGFLKLLSWLPDDGALQFLEEAHESRMQSKLYP